MTQEEFNKQRASGNLKPLPQAEAPSIEQPKVLVPDLATYLVVLEALQRPKRHLTTAPTFIPRNFAEQIQLYDDATNRRIYFYVNGTWRYTTLT